ncbi:hypothetical protein GGU11DRAFT_747611 [Lentinula aff. detonsa]|nr:hypothetical protein GGU11DRAFT_747611 [Lentinula aff. detonsa]
MSSKAVCPCSQCRIQARTDVVAIRTIQQHLALDRECESEASRARQQRIPSPPALSSNPDEPIPAPPSPPIRASKYRKVLVKNPQMPRQDNVASQPSPSALDPNGDAEGGNNGQDDAHTEGGGQDVELLAYDEEIPAEEAVDQIAVALLQGLRIGQREVGDGHGLEGGEGQEDADGQGGEEHGPKLNIEDIQITYNFIRLIQNASLDNSGLDPDTLDRLQNPVAKMLDELDLCTRLSIDMYIAITHASEATYSSIRTAIQQCFPESSILSYHHVQSLIADITGVVALQRDMCINSCHAFTGPFEDLEQCRYCDEPRYDQDLLRRTGEKVPRQQFSTILLGPQLAAIRRSPEGAELRMYRSRKLHNIDEMIASLGPGAEEMVYDDIWCGQDVRNLVHDALLNEDDVAVLLSLCQRLDSFYTM